MSSQSFSLCRLRLPAMAALLALVACGGSGNVRDSSSGSSQASNQLPLPKAHAKVPWTILFYCDADFAGYDPLNDFANDALSSPNVNVVALRTEHYGAGAYYSVDASHRLTTLQTFPALDIGNPRTLRDFTTFAKDIFPADHYLISFYDHGAGWAGACVSDTFGSLLSMEGIREGLEPLGKVDLVCFSAPCDMGAMECAYQLRDVAQVYVGSENTSGYVLWQGIFKSLCNRLETAPTSDPASIGQDLITEMNTKNVAAYPVYTMSASRPGATPELVARLNDLMQFYMGDLATSFAFVKTARGTVQTFSPNYEADLGDLLAQLRAIDTRPQAAPLLDAAQAAYGACIINKGSGSDFPRATGLTILLPKPQWNWYVLYAPANYQLDFSKDCLWTSFFEAAANLP